nr:hypothetical protein [Tanacetum cinerariifolium]
VPVVYMHQFWDSVYKHDTFYIFKIDKRNIFKLNLEVFRDIFKIFPRVQGQSFDALPTNEEIMSFLRDLGHTGKSIYSMMLLLIRCINLRELLLLASTKVYLERRLVLTSFVSPEHKSFRKMYYPRFTKVIIHYFLTQDKTLSWRNKIGMYTSRDDYLINTLRFVSTKEETQINGAILPESLTSPEMKETQAYQTYLGFATGAIPPKKAQKFKKPASPKLTIVPVSTEAPMGKSKRVKRPAKKSTETPTRAEEESLESEAESMGNDKDDSNNEQVSSDEDNDKEKDNDDDKTQSDNENNKENEEDEDDDEDETKISDKAEGGEDEERDYSTSQLYDDVDIRLNEPVDIDEGIVQEEGTDAAMTNAVLAKEYSQPLSSYEAPVMLTEFELKKILIDKMDKSESYLAAPEHRDYYEGLKKSYNLDKTFFSTYGKVYSLKRSRKD